MTGAELLTAVKGRFSLLLVDDVHQLQQLLIAALGQYQDLAGVTKTVRIQTPGPKQLPADWLAHMVAVDANGDFVPVDNYQDENNIEQIEPDASAVYPIRLTYLVNLRAVDLDSYHLPPTAIGMIQDYLEILLSVPNDERLARIQGAGHLDNSRVPTSEVREQQLATLREQMKAQRAVLPMISIQTH